MDRIPYMNIPCIKYDPKDWEYIREKLESFGYTRRLLDENNWVNTSYIVINLAGKLGDYSNVDYKNINNHNRELVINVEEFLERAAKLKGFTYKRKDMKEFKKSDLEPGMVVELRNGYRFLVINNNTEPFIINEDDYKTFSIYNDNLENINVSSLDIVKVFTHKCTGTLKFILYHPRLRLIWERKEFQEYTMQEIADKLGIPAEQLRIKK